MLHAYIDRIESLRRVPTAKVLVSRLCSAELNCTQVSSGNRLSKSSANVFALPVSPAEAGAKATGYCTFRPVESASADSARCRDSLALPNIASRNAPVGFTPRCHLLLNY